MSQNAHTAGKYAIIVAVIGLLGTIGNTLLDNYLSNDSPIEKEDVMVEEDAKTKKEEPSNSTKEATKIDRKSPSNKKVSDILNEKSELSPSNSPHDIYLITDSSLEEIDAIFYENEKLPLVENLPSIKKIKVPQLNRSYQIVIVQQNDTFNCEIPYIEFPKQKVELICQ